MGQAPRQPAPADTFPRGAGGALCREETLGTLLPARPGLAPPSEPPPTAFVFNVLGLFFLFY